MVPSLSFCAVGSLLEAVAIGALCLSVVPIREGSKRSSQFFDQRRTASNPIRNPGRPTSRTPDGKHISTTREAWKSRALSLIAIRNNLSNRYTGLSRRSPVDQARPMFLRAALIRRNNGPGKGLYNPFPGGANSLRRPLSSADANLRYRFPRVPFGKTPWWQSELDRAFPLVFCREYPPTALPNRRPPYRID